MRKQLDYNIIIFSGTIASIDEVQECSKGTWKRRGFSVQCKYDYRKQRRFFCSLWGDDAISMLNDKCVGEPVTVVGVAVSYKVASTKQWKEAIEVKTIFQGGEGLPDLNELYNM
tara:strand:+ start:2107 stop:2448 length:342 start_codon:yes stop_codon:yes gene_type:complete